MGWRRRFLPHGITSGVFKPVDPCEPFISLRGKKHKAQLIWNKIFVIFYWQYQERYFLRLFYGAKGYQKVKQNKLDLNLFYQLIVGEGEI